MLTLSPEQHRDLLIPRLDAQAREVQQPDNYYEGKHPLQFATAKFRQQFGGLFKTLAVNWCRLPVDAVVERLKLEAFDYGDEASNQAADDIRQANDMGLKSRMLHSEAIKLRAAYALVEPGASKGDTPRIYVEHPSQMIVHHAPGRREIRLAALKKWLDEDGYIYVYLYRPEAVYKWRAEIRHGTSERPEWESIGGEENTLGAVPVVPFYNSQQMLRDGVSDLKPAIPIQDILNKLIADMLVDSEATAFVQRWVTGWEVPKDANGRPLPETELMALRSKFLTFRDKDVKVGELQGANLDRFVAPIGMVIQHFSAVTRMPPHYLTGTIVNASGDALKAAETGLSFKAEGKTEDFSAPHKETQRLAFLAMGDKARAQKTSVRLEWGDTERKSEAERTDAAVKARSVGVPFEEVWSMLGFTSQQITRMKGLAGLPDRPPPGATTAQAPPVTGAQNGTPSGVVLPAGASA